VEIKQEKKVQTPEYKSAIQLIVFFGLISLFGDIVYEGARSVNGPYLKTLAVNAALVGFIAGFGELMGYALRLLSGYYADKTKAYWVFTFVGYGLVIAVPLLSLAGVWQVAAVMMVAERIGKGLRAPAKDTIVSSAAKKVGTGFGFGLQEALDQIGALLGPLIFAAYFAFNGATNKTAVDYRHAYSLFWIPFILVMVFVVIAYLKVPDPTKFEPPPTAAKEPDKLSKLFWIYTFFAFTTALGFISFAIMGYHFKAKNILTDAMIPVYYAIAMVVDGGAALVIGIWYDKLKIKYKNHAAGLITLMTMPLLSAIIPFMAFSNSKWVAFSSAVLWGIVMGAHETVMKSAIADITPMKKRGTGYGVFSTAYGLALFAGAFVAGILYDFSIPVLCWAIVVVQVIATVIFVVMNKEIGMKVNSSEFGA